MVRSACTAVLWIACTGTLVHTEGVRAQEQVTRIGANPYLVDGAHALSIGSYDEAIRHTQRGLAEPIERTDRSAALSNLCGGFDGTGDYRRALESCDAALAIDDGNWQAYGNRAIAHLRLGQLEAARADVEHGLVLNPTSSGLLAVQKLVTSSEATRQPSPPPRMDSGQEPRPE